MPFLSLYILCCGLWVIGAGLTHHMRRPMRRAPRAPGGARFTANAYELMQRLG